MITLKTVIKNREDAIRTAAELIASFLRDKPDSVLALSGVRLPEDFFDELVKLFENEELSLAQARILAVEEFCSIAADSAQSSRSVIQKQLIERTDAEQKNFFVPDENAPEAFDELIGSLGGIDFAVLGLGDNASFGFNEPFTEYAAGTHVHKLKDATRAELAERFGGAENVPESGVTVGVKALCDSRETVVLAVGENKAEAVYKMLYARDDGIVPAAFLQLPMNVTVCLDGEAAEKL